MGVHHADGLHQREHGGGANKREALFPQRLGQRHGFGRLRGDVGVGGRPGRGAGLELPDEVNQASPFPERDGGAGIGDGGPDFEPVADNAGVLQQTLDIRLGEGGNSVRVEMWKALRKAGRLRRMVAQDRPAWNPSRLMRSYSPCSSRTGRPHSES